MFSFFQKYLEHRKQKKYYKWLECYAIFQRQKFDYFEKKNIFE